ncbi:hypothetical protein DFS34DRAFT_648221 [Phlyctochytrium arcticum]|nr:hypothetical protein DFS34DRAFT_648221 [Phlyctochytrium arcticum]
MLKIVAATLTIGQRPPNYFRNIIPDESRDIPLDISACLRNNEEPFPSFANSASWYLIKALKSGTDSAFRTARSQTPTTPDRTPAAGNSTRVNMTTPPRASGVERHIRKPDTPSPKKTKSNKTPESAAAANGAAEIIAVAMAKQLEGMRVMEESRMEAIFVMEGNRIKLKEEQAKELLAAYASKSVDAEGGAEGTEPASDNEEAHAQYFSMISWSWDLMWNRIPIFIKSTKVVAVVQITAPEHQDLRSNVVELETVGAPSIRNDGQVSRAGDNWAPTLPHLFHMDPLSRI